MSQQKSYQNVRDSHMSLFQKLKRSVELLKNLFEQIGTLSKIFDFSGKS